MKSSDSRTVRIVNTSRRTGAVRIATAFVFRWFGPVTVLSCIYLVGRN